MFTGRTDAEAETESFSHLMWRADSLEKTLMLGKTEGQGEEQHRIRWSYRTTNSMDMSLGNEPLLVSVFAAFLGLPTTWAPATINSPIGAPATGPQSQMRAHHWLWPPPLLVMTLGSGTRGTAENTNYHSSDSRPPATLAKHHTVVSAVDISSLSQTASCPPRPSATLFLCTWNPAVHSSVPLPRSERLSLLKSGHRVWQRWQLF